jgi:LPS O-antigen subunit length determinant protein (WzzB/FepE family)
MENNNAGTPMTNTEQKPENIPSISKPDDDEISLIDLFVVLWWRKRMIITITVIAILTFSVL